MPPPPELPPEPLELLEPFPPQDATLSNVKRTPSAQNFWTEDTAHTVLEEGLLAILLRESPRIVCAQCAWNMPHRQFSLECQSARTRLDAH